MRKSILMGILATTVLAMPAIPAAAQSAGDVRMTCRSALDGLPFEPVDRRSAPECCYVEPEKPWYDINGVVLNQSYLRSNGDIYHTRQCSPLDRDGAALGGKPALGNAGAGSTAPGANAGVPGSQPVTGVHTGNVPPGAAVPDGNGTGNGGNVPADDGDNGHGNDADGHDSSNPGQSGGKAMGNVKRGGKGEGRDNGGGNGVQDAPGNSGDKPGDDADGVNTPGTIDTGKK